MAAMEDTLTMPPVPVSAIASPNTSEGYTEAMGVSPWHYWADVLVNSSFVHTPGIPIWHTRDLVRWTQIGHVLTRPSQLPFDGLGISRGIFAPTIRYYDGMYYTITTWADSGGDATVTATDPAGPWSAPVWLNFSGIDPDLFVDYVLDRPNVPEWAAPIPTTGNFTLEDDFEGDGLAVYWMSLRSAETDWQHLTDGALVLDAQPVPLYERASRRSPAAASSG